ncbi:aspartate aminotransferase family protein [Planctomicrobium sp.]|nr:aspartate aminotransferase family protein [Planctomicrobium sp.]MDB4732884.1 aspartate aminotransferase family protein [Planctomicrobium sp.]
MNDPIHFNNEPVSNQTRASLTKHEPKSLRTFTPSQAVFAKSAGVFHWTPEERRLYDYSSGVLVANLGHNPRRWMRRFFDYLGWNESIFSNDDQEYYPAVTMTAYNAMTGLEATATERLCQSLQSFPGGNRLEQVMWSASGSEAVQKALWACLHRDHDRKLILATRHGFHGKKGLAGAVTGSEESPDRDPRVKFISFPMEECDDIDSPSKPLDLQCYQDELDQLWQEHGEQINCLITEPYLGGGGSFHPPKEYLQMVQAWCREHDIAFILDEVQANFGRTGKMYAFEAYGLEPDFVCLGKGLGNGVPVSAAVGRADIMAHMSFGEASDTWSANPISCAAVLATLDEFESTNVMEQTQKLNEIFTAGLLKLKESPIIAKIRGEGLVYGVECAPVGEHTGGDVANAIVKECYLGESDGDGIHLLGALATKVLRVSPPMTMTEEQAHTSLELFTRLIQRTAEKLQPEAAVSN